MRRIQRLIVLVLLAACSTENEQALLLAPANPEQPSLSMGRNGVFSDSSYRARRSSQVRHLRGTSISPKQPTGNGHLPNGNSFEQSPRLCGDTRYPFVSTSKHS